MSASKVTDKGKTVIQKQNVALEKLEIQYLPITGVKPNAYNPNRQSEHEFEMLMSSMREDGFTQPILCAKDESGQLVIVDGEHRWRAAFEIGLTEVPVVVVPMGVAQAKIATLRHNRARGSEDIELAVEVMRDLEKLGATEWAMDSLDMSDAEWQKLMEDVPAPEALAAAEFGEAWEPNKEGTVTRGTRAGEGGTTMVDSTPAAIKAAREREVALAKATTDEERAKVVKDKAIYGLSLSFAGEEAEVVRHVLKDSPAITVLRLCRDAMGDFAAPPTQKPS